MQELNKNASFFSVKNIQNMSIRSTRKAEVIKNLRFQSGSIIMHVCSVTFFNLAIENHLGVSMDYIFYCLRSAEELLYIRRSVGRSGVKFSIYSVGSFE